MHKSEIKRRRADLEVAKAQLHTVELLWRSSKPGTKVLELKKEQAQTAVRNAQLALGRYL